LLLLDNTRSDATRLGRLHPEIAAIVGARNVQATYRVASREKMINEIYQVEADTLAAMTRKELYKIRWVAYATVRPTSATQLKELLDTCRERDIGE
jgi:hypothetical protein